MVFVLWMDTFCNVMMKFKDNAKKFQELTYCIVLENDEKLKMLFSRK